MGVVLNRSILKALFTRLAVLCGVSLFFIIVYFAVPEKIRGLNSSRLSFYFPLFVAFLVIATFVIGYGIFLLWKAIRHKAGSK
jgi:hypothetical protein